MLRMEIALFLVIAFVAFSYFSAEKRFSQLHRTFSMLLVVVLLHLVFDGITVYTVNHLDTVPVFLNNTFHRLFIGTMILIFFLFYQYIAADLHAHQGPFLQGQTNGGGTNADAAAPGWQLCIGTESGSG